MEPLCLDRSVTWWFTARQEKAVRSLSGRTIWDKVVKVVLARSVVVVRERRSTPPH